jgi:deoxyadenosine/deoxycytidine kinase
MIVWLSGPTGAGKSSMARIFSALGYARVQERLPIERFEAFASDPIRHCAPLQEEIMRSRFEAWRDLSSAGRVIFDRSLDEDARVFCRMHHELGFLDDNQYKELVGLAEKLQSLMPHPDLILFMCPDRDVLAKRVTQLEHPPVIVKSLHRQLSLYGEWLATRHEEILKLDNSTCSLQTVKRLFEGGTTC